MAIIRIFSVKIQRRLFLLAKEKAQILLQLETQMKF